MYTLAFDHGLTLRFYVLDCARVFQQCYGGRIEWDESLVGVE